MTEIMFHPQKIDGVTKEYQICGGFGAKKVWAKALNCRTTAAYDRPFLQ